MPSDGYLDPGSTGVDAYMDQCRLMIAVDGYLPPEQQSCGTDGRGLPPKPRGQDTIYA